MKFKRICAMLVASVFVMGSVIGCSSSSSESSGSDTSVEESTEESSAEETAEETEEETASTTASGTVKILVSVTGGKDDEEMELFEAAMEEATGLDIELEMPASDYDSVMLQKLGNAEEYDLVYVVASQYASLVEQGALLDITEYVENSEILSNNIEQSEWDDITIDGKVYAGFNKKEVHRVVALNNTLLKEAGIDYTTIEPTMDGYYEVFKAMQEVSDVEGFYAFNVVMSQAWDLQPWFAALGMKTGVQLNEDGLKYVPISTDEAAPVWEWFKQLYDEGLMDPSAFVDGTSDMRDKMSAASQQTGVTVDWAAWVGLHNANALSDGLTSDDYEIVSLPGLETPDGSYMLAKGSASLFAVPANAQNVEGAIAVLEYFATQEGGELLSIGIEDYDYTVDGDTYTQTEIGAAHANDHGAPVPIYKDFVNPLGYNPGMQEALDYGEYASIEMVISDETEYKEIVGKWGIQIIRGETTVEEGLAGMRAELLELGVTEV